VNHLRRTPALLALLGLLAVSTSHAESLSNTLDVYVFPSAGQDASQQSMDESACYEWAVQNSGSDPFDLAKQQETAEQQAEAQKAAAGSETKGSGARGALGGAAAGALIGEVVDDDAGKGAAWGAAVGGVANRRRHKRAEQEQVQAIEQQQASQAQYTAEEIDNFKKAFSVCLEAKDYMVKY
jgi:hypothetical protein